MVSVYFPVPRDLLIAFMLHSVVSATFDFDGVLNFWKAGYVIQKSGDNSRKTTSTPSWNFVVRQNIFWRDYTSLCLKDGCREHEFCALTHMRRRPC